MFVKTQFGSEFRQWNVQATGDLERGVCRLQVFWSGECAVCRCFGEGVCRLQVFWRGECAGCRCFGEGSVQAAGDLERGVCRLQVIWKG